MGTDLDRMDLGDECIICMELGPVDHCGWVDMGLDLMDLGDGYIYGGSRI